MPRARAIALRRMATVLDMPVPRPSAARVKRAAASAGVVAFLVSLGLLAGLAAIRVTHPEATCFRPDATCFVTAKAR